MIWSKDREASKGSQLTSVISTRKQKPRGELETKQMSQIFQTAKSVLVLGSADPRVLEIFHQVFDEIASSFSFILGENYLALISNS